MDVRWGCRLRDNVVFPQQHATVTLTGQVISSVTQPIHHLHFFPLILVLHWYLCRNITQSNSGINIFQHWPAFININSRNIIKDSHLIYCSSGSVWTPIELNNSWIHEPAPCMASYMQPFLKSHSSLHDIWTNGPVYAVVLVIPISEIDKYQPEILK